jgi:integrase
LKRHGYRESTVVSRVKMLRSLARRADLSDPESIKSAIADLDVFQGRKENLVCTYRGFCGQYGIPFQAPRYRRVDQLPFIPLESEVDQLIAGMGAKMSTYLTLLKETGARAGEAWKLTWTEIDAERQIVSIVPEKNGKPRQLKITGRLLSMLERLPIKGDYVFGGRELDNFARRFYISRQCPRSKRKKGGGLVMGASRRPSVVLSSGRCSRRNSRGTLSFSRLLLDRVRLSGRARKF